MSMYTHVCECQHRHYSHSPAGRCGCNHCPCKKAVYGPTMLVTTFDGNGQPVERCIEPGDGLRSLTGLILAPACDCDEGVAAHAAVAS